MQVRYQAAPRPARETDAPRMGSPAGCASYRSRGECKNLGADGLAQGEIEAHLGKSAGLIRLDIGHAADAGGGLPQLLACLDDGLVAMREVTQIALVGGHPLAAHGMDFMGA